jgi:hypothetical protein
VKKRKGKIKCKTKTKKKKENLSCKKDDRNKRKYSAYNNKKKISCEKKKDRKNPQRKICQLCKKIKSHVQDVADGVDERVLEHVVSRRAVLLRRADDVDAAAGDVAADADALALGSI